MFGRTRLLLILLVLAVAVPIGLSHRSKLPGLSQTIGKWIGTAKNALSSGDSAALAVETDTAKETRVGRGPADLTQVFRFNVSPAWVMAQWSRVSSSLRDGKLQGLRVAYVSGTGNSDVAGALTYYFNARQQLQRIYFEGYTGDANQLIGFIAKNYQLRASPSLGSGVFISGWNGSPTSLMRIRYAPIVQDASPNTRQEVMLELNRPGIGFGLSPRAKNIMRMAG